MSDIDVQLMALRKARLVELQNCIQEHRFAAVAFNASPSLFYYYGLSFHLSERPVVSILTADGRNVCVLPELELGKLEAWRDELQVFAYGEDPSSWQKVFNAAWLALGLEDKASVGIEAHHLRMLEYQFLQAADAQARFVSAESWLALQRACKDATEKARHQKAVDIAQAGLLAVLLQVKLGMSERELASELTAQLLRHGADAELPFQPSVGFGENSANPHAVPGDRRLAYGDLLLIDWGASYEGYAADLTRIFSIGETSSEWKRIANTVKQANEAARAAAKVGVTPDEVDRAARQIIEQDGYAEFFPHRVGHGLGLEVHELPYLRKDNQEPLRAGMVFTIEPGIYLPGRGGVRIEDDCFLDAKGCETLSTLPRDLGQLL